MEQARHDQVPPLVSRLRVVAVCLLLTLLAFVQDPGRIAVDTKLDLTANPVGFLGRALHLWDPQAAFGQLQNQATGYLWPMGPFFALGHLVQLPAWVIQRTWWSLLMVVAFLGFRKVAERMGIGSPLTRALLGFAFACSPRIQSQLGATSIESLPLAMTPWVLLPLVSAAQGRVSNRVGAARSGLAVLCIGGVNAVATLAALPVSGLFLLCQLRGRVRLRLVRWWIVAVALAVLWWLIPLVLLGKYSPPFLDYIESSTVTTGVTSLPEALRGTSDWIGFLATSAGPTWPAAWRLVTDPITVLNTLLLAGLGLYGLSRRELPYRAFLVLSVLLGLFLVTAGHVSSVDGFLAPSLRTALDSSLAPFRNVHKFDAVIRLPLMLGACHGLSSIQLPELRRIPGERFAQGLTGVVIVGVVSPLLLGLVVPPGSYESIPSYWQQAADFLASQHDQGRSLLLPGSPFATYAWGSTGDEPLQPLASSAWAVRNGIPLAPAGNIRVLDAIDQRLAHGYGSIGLTNLLERSGVGLLVVRNDLDWATAGAPRPVLVHQALAESPDITRIAAFGPATGTASGDDVLADAGLDQRYPAIEVFRVGKGGARADTYPAATAVQLDGGPEALLAAGDVGLTRGRATTLAGQPSVPGSSEEVVTDTLRRTEVSFSALPGDRPTLAADDPYRVVRVAHDYLPVTGTRRQTVTEPLGVQRISASSSGSDIDALVDPGAQYAPGAAFDGSLVSYWHSGTYGDAVGQWLQVDLLRQLQVSSISLALSTAAPLSVVSRVTVTTDRGSRTTDVAAIDTPQRIPTVPGLTRHVRVTISGVRGGGSGIAAGIRELAIPRLIIDDATLRTPVASGPNPDVLLSAVPLATDPCVNAGANALCSPQLVTPGVADVPMDRMVTTTAADSYGVSVRARARPGDALNVLLDKESPVQVTASSEATIDPESRPATVLDGDLGTGWVASLADLNPTLTLTWTRPTRISRLRIVVGASLAASHPVAATVIAGGHTTTGRLSVEGSLWFRPVTTTKLVLQFNPFKNRAATDEATGGFASLPVGVSELDVPGLPSDALSPAASRVLPCGSGPTVHVDGTTLSTKVTATVGQLLAMTPVQTFTCAGRSLSLLAGQHHVTAVQSDTFDPQTVELVTLQPAGSTDKRQATTREWKAQSRTVEMTAGPSTVLVVHENVNAGWRATFQGHVLTPITIDGWQQGWLVPAGSAGMIALSYTPGRGYLIGLVVGALAVLVLLLLCVRGPALMRPDASVRTGLPWPAILVAGALLSLMGGLPGLGAAIVVWLILWRWDLSPWLIAVGMLGCAGLAEHAPWPRGRGLQSAAAQVLVLVAVAAVLRSDGRGGRERSMDAPPADS